MNTKNNEEELAKAVVAAIDEDSLNEKEMEQTEGGGINICGTNTNCKGCKGENLKQLDQNV
ncbi:hypothetical protein [Phocaeicola sp.]